MTWEGNEAMLIVMIEEIKKELLANCLIEISSNFNIINNEE